MGLIIPRPDVPIKFACTMPGCDAIFTADERHQYERHVLSHPLEDVQAISPAHQAPALFGRGGGDTDWTAWVQKHREQDPRGLRWDKWGKTGDGKHSSGDGDGN
jgi:hypothetical protein